MATEATNLSLAAAPRTRALFLSACGGMFVFGCVLAVLGVAFGLPDMRARLNLNLAQEGNLFLVMYLGLLLSNLIVGPLIDRIGNKLLLLVSALLVAVGLIGFAAVHSFATAAIAAFVLGFGGSGLNTCANALVSALYPANRAAMLSLLALFFGFGGLSIPLLAAAITGVLTVPQLLVATAALPIACAAAYVLLQFPPGQRRSSFTDTLRAIGLPGMAGIIVILFFESGNEASLGGWTSTYVGAAGWPPRTATMILACYWAMMMLTRLVAHSLLKRIAKPQMLLISGIGAVLGCSIMLSAHSVAMLTLGTCVIGASFAPIFPTALGIAGDRYPEQVGSVFGMLFATSLVGGMLAPWSVGHIAHNYAVRYGMLVPLAGAIAITVVSTVLVKKRTPDA